MKNLASFLDDYGAASGQIINKETSCFYLGKNASTRQRTVADSLGFAEVSFPFTCRLERKAIIYGSQGGVSKNSSSEYSTSQFPGLLMAVSLIKKIAHLGS